MTALTLTRSRADLRSRSLRVAGGAAVAALLIVVGALIVAARPSQASTVPASMQNLAFSPASLTVNAGDTVTWTNHDQAPHTVTTTSGPASFASSNLNQGDTFSYTFTKAGVYHYYCTIHPNMTGMVTVNGATSAPPPQASQPAPPPPTTAPPGQSGGGHPAPSPTGGGMPGMGAPAPSGGGASCSDQALATAMLTPFVVHLDHAHLGESPAQQAGDLMNLNQYTLTHTVLVENMLSPLFTVLEAAPSGLDAFFTHLDHAHLEESPAQQVSDISNVSQYVNTHTVLVENMLAPTISAAEGTWGC
jgi:plastocyanin